MNYLVIVFHKSITVAKIFNAYKLQDTVETLAGHTVLQLSLKFKKEKKQKRYCHLSFTCQATQSLLKQF